MQINTSIVLFVDPMKRPLGKTRVHVQSIYIVDPVGLQNLQLLLEKVIVQQVVMIGGLNENKRNSRSIESKTSQIFIQESSGIIEVVYRRVYKIRKNQTCREMFWDEKVQFRITRSMRKPIKNLHVHYFFYKLYLFSSLTLIQKQQHYFSCFRLLTITTVTFNSF